MITRPWGKMWLLIDTPTFWVKVLHVIGRTSLQTHTNRIEWHLSFLKFKRVSYNESHRMEHNWFLEFAWAKPGTTLSENDIIRYSDDYGRATNIMNKGPF